MSYLDSFVRATDRVVEFNQYFISIPQTEHTLHKLEIQKDEIVHQWNTLRSAYDNLLSNLESQEEEVNFESIKGKFYTAYNAHLNCLSFANELVDRLSYAHTPVTDVIRSPPNTNIALPPCDCDVFHGDYVSWPAFRDMFSALYRNNSRLSPVEKLFHLLKKTQGEARAILKTCPLTNEGFEMAWQNLIARYDNKRVLINAQLKTLLNLTRISKESGHNIKELQRTINDCISNLAMLQIDTDNWDILFVYICSTCLPDLTLNLWEQSLNNYTDLPKWKDLDSFLSARFQTLESVADIRSTTNQPVNKTAPLVKNQNHRDRKSVNSYHTQVSDNAKKCTLCDDSHPLRLCNVFLKMSVDDRYATVKKQKRCTNCMATSHEYKKCKSQYVCSICQMKHHSLLHRPNQPSNTSQSKANLPSSISPQSAVSNQDLNNSPSTSAGGTRQSYSTHLQSTFTSSILLGTALVEVCLGDSKFRARALVDPASEASFITKQLQSKLALPTKSSQIGIIGLSGSLTATSSQVCSITIGSSLDSNFKASFEFFVVKKLTGQLTYQSYMPHVKATFAGLQLANEESNDSNVDLLLGGNIYPTILREGVRWDSERILIAQKTVFGWIVTGNVTSANPSPTVVSLYNEIALNDQLARFWELEEIPKVAMISNEDQYCEQLFQSTTYRNATGRYVVSLPFKQGFPNDINVGNSRNIALSQYLRNESRLGKDPQLKADYNKVIGEYLTLGHMIPVSPMSSNSYYLPHHAVIKPDSTTTRLRVVFNASNPSSNGISLNDVLYPGPVLQTDLTVLLLKWRHFRYVFNADIEKMYRQILVDPKHSPYQRILHRNKPQEEPHDFELNTVTFGVNCAPYLAIRVLRELATQCASESPVVSDILRNYMYVDDVLWGSSNLSTCLDARDDLVRVLNSAGFSLRKWTSNNNALLQGIPPEHLLDSAFLKLSDTSTTKMLGLRWNAGGDYFYFLARKSPDLNVFSKRTVLSIIAMIFDPAGWLAPKIIVAKIIMQQIWKDKTDWDEILEPATLAQWHKFLDDYPNIEIIKIPRYVLYDISYNIEYHGFCDASEKAYAAALYIRVVTPDCQIRTNLLTAKSKVAPVKFVTLPRKELCGAVLLARMINFLKSDLQLSNHHVYLWTDSTIVLAWLRKPPCSWNTFVANRVNLIVDKVGTSNWSHVSSQDNPADLASRGMTAKELHICDLWWKGPPWLSLPQSSWPVSPNTWETDHELRPVKAHVNQLSELDILSRFSNLPRALRVISYIFRFFRLTHPDHRQEAKYDTRELCHFEIKYVKARLTLLCQKIYLPEYSHLVRGMKLPRDSNLLSLNPFIDSDGIMRSNGRLSQSPTLSYDERYPKILPYSGRFTRLHLEFLHKLCCHGENSLMLRLVRVEFCVPKLKNLIRTIIFNCKICVVFKHKRSQQIMAALPPERTVLTRPFANTGIDFAGPFDIKSYVGRGTKVTKGYVLVFVCFATKAIHLEVTSEISTQAFLAAFARFFSRRGAPNAIYSDNGTVFIGAANIIAKDHANLMTSVRQQLFTQYANQPIEWHFIPPGAPHMGGLWEAGVKSFKTHLKRIAHSQHFTYEEFYTMLTRIEACLNSRPLSPMSETPSDLCALTPGHFLIGSALLAPAEPDCSQMSLTYANRWQKLKLLHHQFAIRWKEEYLKELNKRVKWKYPQRNFVVGDLVVVRYDNLPPNQWRLGRIERVVVGTDSKVRVAEIRTLNGLITRPISNMSTPPRRLQNERTRDESNHQVQKLPFAQERSRKDCRYCQKDHPLRKCRRFHQLSTTKRLKIARQFGYCINCLAHSHQIRNCRSREKCKVCFSKHHTLLHDGNNQNSKKGRKRQQNRKAKNLPSQTGMNLHPANSTTSRSATIIINVNPAT